ncbi:flavodoxin [Enterococcus faecalis]|uniref:flavodoxin n=1 Tax=Enterococcus TaxID=1350 RepID=UPI0025B0B614|nr:flavodoxin [Enterococcus faecalis]MDN3139682.1 flavodoxin [Enterococcus faecalis]
MFKKRISYFLIAFISFIIVEFITLPKMISKIQEGGEMMKNPKTLIAYYSRTGNTKAVAELIQEKIAGDLIQIETEEKRPIDYPKEVEQNALEQERDILPELTTTIPDFDKYERIFIGTPTWNMALPQAVVSFLDSYDFTGKTIIPFNTHGGYGVGSTFSQISANTKGANVLEGYTVKGGEETNGLMLIIKDKNREKVSKEIDTWLETIN